MNEQKHKNEAISLASGAGDYYFAKAESSTESSTKPEDQKKWKAL
jgi:hypothetical protein